MAGASFDSGRLQATEASAVRALFNWFRARSILIAWIVPTAAVVFIHVFFHDFTKKTYQYFEPWLPEPDTIQVIIGIFILYYMCIVLGSVGKLLQDFSDAREYFRSAADRQKNIQRALDRQSEDLKSYFRAETNSLEELKKIIDRVDDRLISIDQVKAPLGLLAEVEGIDAHEIWVKAARNQLSKKLEEFSELSNHIRNDIVYFDDEAWGEMYDLFLSARNIIRAISDVPIDGRSFWATTEGKNYLDVHEEAIQKSGGILKIHRVFLAELDDWGRKPELWQSILDRNLKAGASVWVYFMGGDKRIESSGFLHDFIVFGDEENNPIAFVISDSKRKKAYLTRRIETIRELIRTHKQLTDALAHPFLTGKSLPDLIKQEHERRKLRGRQTTAPGQSRL
jgi:hypothetical protein